MSEKSECCDMELWGVDCPECHGDCWLNDDEFCPQCDGGGYIDGEKECSGCGEIYDD